MKNQGISLRMDVIRERAETGGSWYCAVTGEKKKTQNSRVTAKCAHMYSGVAKMVDEAVEAYKACQQAAKNANPTTSSEKKPGPQTASGISSQEFWWLVNEMYKQVHLLTANGGSAPDDRVMVKAMMRMESSTHYTEDLCRRVVKKMHERQSCRAAIEPFFSFKTWLGGQKDYEVFWAKELENQYHPKLAHKVVKEIGNEHLDNFYETKAKPWAARYVSSRDVHSGMTEKEIGSTASTIAREISDNNDGVYGLRFKKIFRAVVEEIQRRLENMGAVTVQKRKERIETAAAKSGQPQTAETGRDEHLRQRRAKAAKLKAIMDNHVDAWKAANGSRMPWVHPVDSIDDAKMLENHTLVLLGGKVCKVKKTSGGNASVDPVDFKVVFEDPALTAKVQHQQQVEKPTVRGRMYVTITTDKGSKTLLAIMLGPAQFGKETVVCQLREGSYVTEETTARDKPLVQVKGEKVRRHGTCRKATAEERKACKTLRAAAQKRGTDTVGEDELSSAPAYPPENAASQSAATA